MLSQTAARRRSTLPDHAPQRGHLLSLTVAAVAVVSMAVYWITAYPSITWWDSSMYSLAAGTLGLTGPPGSLVLTLLGWVVAWLPFGSVAHTLNLFAGTLAALTTSLVFLLAVRMNRMTRGTGNAPFLAGAALGALALAFGATLWQYAVQFSPYVLTVVFTGLILWNLLRWWEEAESSDAWRRLMMLGLLFGLDFSVHRTNALLIPGTLIWVALRRPRTFRSPRAWLGSTAGLVAGLAVQLLVIPIAAGTGSVLNIGDPSSWSRFWSYVSLQSQGGGFLLGVFPRKSALWSVQTADVVRVFAQNFFAWRGPLGPLIALSGIVGLIGLGALWRRDRRLSIAFAALLLLQAKATVLYFNIPAHFFRSLDRHYLPICVVYAVLVAYGMGVVLGDLTARARRRGPVLAAVAIVVALVVPTSQLTANWSANDASRRYFAQDYAENALRALPPHAILFTVGDNDTFPLWYVQAVEGVRPDVQIVNLSLANTGWYVDQLARRDPSFPLSLTHAERLALKALVPWHDTTIAVPVEGTAAQLGLPPGTEMPPSITLDAKPTYGTHVLASALVLLDVVQTNHWRRPLCFNVSVGPTGMGWLQPYGRQEGLYWRIVPTRDPAPDLATFRRNVFETYRYRGLADSRLQIDRTTQVMVGQYAAAFMILLREDQKSANPAQCKEDQRRVEALLPPERQAEIAPAVRQGIEGACGGR